MNVLISACLLGVNCRYNAQKSATTPSLTSLMQQFHLIPVCPEILGGMSTPRLPSEIKGAYVFNKNGENVTAFYERGAQETLALAKLFGCTAAILKERSPSCGCGKIYDGSFSGTLTEGNGVTAQLLMQNGIRVLGESEIDKLWDLKNE